MKNYYPFCIVKVVIAVAFSSANLFTTSAQFNNSTLAAKLWEHTTGTPDTIDWNSSALDGSGNLIVVGNTMVTTNNTDMLITKYTTDGTVLWQVQYDHTNNNRDYGVAVAIDASDDIYVAGTSIASTGNGYDWVIQKYNDGGTLVWEEQYNGPGSSYDVPTDMVLDGAGALYVVGASYGTTSLSDYCTRKYSASNGTFIWEARYDYTSLLDIPAAITLGSSARVYVTGGSASSFTNWDFATVKYNATTGAQVTVTRNSSSGLGLDHPTALAKDQYDNIYVTGAAMSGSQFDIKTVKLDDELNTVWSVTWDNVALDDQANSIGVDANGYVYITGYTKKINGGSDFITIKYNGSGTLQWEKFYSAPDETKGATARKLDINSYGGDILVTGDVYNIDNKDFLTLGYDPSGNIKFQEWFGGIGNGEDVPMAVKVGVDNLFYVTGKVWTGTQYSYLTVKYEMIDYITPPDTEGGSSIFAYYENNGQLIGTDGSAQSNVKFYSARHFPALYFQNNKISSVFAKTDTNSTTSDTLHRIDLSFYNSFSVKVNKISPYVSGYQNFFLPHCTTGVTGVRGYQRLLYPDLYTETDLMVYGNEAGVKFYFICDVGSRPADIQMKYNGAVSETILGSGKLKITSKVGSVTYEQPEAFQLDASGNVISLAWQPTYSSLGGNKFGFNLGSYDLSKPLIILMKKSDPPGSPQLVDNLKWSTYFGSPNTGLGAEVCSDIKTDDLNFIYVAGSSDNHNFPISTGYTSTNLGQGDAFFVKFSSEAVPQWISYYGGSNLETSCQIAIDDSYNVYFTGVTFSINIPPKDYNPGTSFYETSGSAFIGRLNETGTDLEWSSYLPGVGSVRQMISRSIGRATNEFFVVGGLAFASTNFPLKKENNEFYQSTGSSCGYIFNFDAECNQVWGTLYGQNTELRGIAFDGFDHILLAGKARNVEPLILANPNPGVSYYETVIQNEGIYDDIVIGKLNGDKSLYWGTYFGGISDEQGYSIAADKNGNIFVSGLEEDIYNNSNPPLPFENNVSALFYVDYLSDSHNGFIVEFAPDGDLLWGTLFGGTTVPGSGSTPVDNIYSITSFNYQIFGAGFTSCTDLPYEQYANFYDDASLQLSATSTNNGDGFLFSFNGGGNHLYSSYFGGDGAENIERIYCDGQNLFIVGSVANVNSVNIPLAEVDPISFNDFYQGTFSDLGIETYDGFISEFDLSEIIGVEPVAYHLTTSPFVFPNPAQSIVNIKFPAFYHEYELTILDISGRVVYERELIGDQNFHQVNLSYLSKGIFTIVIKSESGVFVNKLVLQ